MEAAALASSIFLVARKRQNTDTGNYANNVLPEMRRIVRERVRFFLELGVTGADLNIATIGAGLAPYTSYARVELPNGDELTAADYLTEVQAEVVRVLLGEAANADKATQYYIIARENYGEAWVDFDEANNLARATGIELDSGSNALTRGHAAQIEKKGAKVRLRNFAERGADKALGLPTIEHPKAPLIDVLHRLLWLAENDNSEIGQFLLDAAPDRHWLRVVAESLKGTVLAGEPTPGAMRDSRSDEQRAIGVLLASWRRIVDEGKMV
jgi:putative DNA methylase